jgi:hypothetical protein
MSKKPGARKTKPARGRTGKASLPSAGIPDAPSPAAAAPKRARRGDLAAEARDNPFRFFTSEEMGIMFDFGENVMTTLRGMGAPVVGRKMNPMLLLEWLKENHDRVPKVRGESEMTKDEG